MIDRLVIANNNCELSGIVASLPVILRNHRKTLSRYFFIRNVIAYDFKLIIEQTFHAEVRVLEEFNH